jgi:hypothetical protein
MHAPQLPSHAVLQQTSLTQWLLLHSLFAEQPSPMSSSVTVVVVTVVVVVVLTVTTAAGWVRSHDAPFASVQLVVVMSKSVSLALPWKRQNASAEPEGIPFGLEMWMVS